MERLGSEGEIKPSRLDLQSDRLYFILIIEFIRSPGEVHQPPNNIPLTTSFNGGKIVGGI